MIKILHKLIVFVCLIVTIAIGQKVYAEQVAQEPTEAPGFISEEFLLDPDNSYSIDQVQGIKFSATEKEAKNLLKKLNPNRGVWIKLTAKNPSSENFKGYIFSRTISERTYYCTEKDTLKKTTVGFLHPNKSDVIFFDRYLVPINLKPGEERTIYIHSREFIRYIHSKPLITGIAKKSDFDQLIVPAGSSSLINLQVFFSGLLIFQLLYIIIQWSLLRRTEYIYYALYIISLFAYFWPRQVLSTLSIEGIEIPIAHFVASANDILLVLPTFFYFRFSRYFIDMPQHNPNWNRIIKRFEYVFIILTIIVALTNSIIPNDLPKDIILMTCVGIQFILTLIALRGFFAVQTLLKRFIIAAGIIAITAHVFSMILTLFFYPNINIAPIAVTMVGIIMEIAIFNSGLLFKGREMEKDKFKAQMKFLKEVESKQKIQLEYAGVRDKIARDLHDDIGSTLSSVSIYSYAAKERLAKGEIEQTKDLIASIEKNALSTLNSMSDLVWAINPSNDSTEKLLERLNSFGYEILGAKECSFDTEIDPSFYKYNSNLEQRRSLLLICKEALNNAAKYSGASKVNLKITPVDERFRVIISDNGSGFNIDLSKKGNGLVSMRIRAKSLSDHFEITTNKSGTSIIFDI